jgi:hypothetical protein
MLQLPPNVCPTGGDVWATLFPHIIHSLIPDCHIHQLAQSEPAEIDRGTRAAHVTERVNSEPIIMFPLCF